MPLEYDAKRMSVRLPAKERKMLAALSAGGRPAYLHGLSALDVLHGKPVLRPEIVADAAGPAPAGARLRPLSGSLKQSLGPVPSPALGICIDAEGRIHDTYHALPALRYRSVAATHQIQSGGMDACSALALLALASRYGLGIGPSTAKRIRQAGHIAQDSLPDMRKWLRVFLSGQGIAALMESCHQFFVGIIPELGPCRGLTASPARHAYDVYGHMAHAAQACRTDSCAVRMALLLHDIGKPAAASVPDAKVRFPQHAVLGRDIADGILERLGYPALFRYQVTDLILYHDQPVMPEKASYGAWMRRLGPDGLAQLMEMKRADIMAHSEKAGQRLLCRWEEARKYLMLQGIQIPP